MKIRLFFRAAAALIFIAMLCIPAAFSLWQGAAGMAPLKKETPASAPEPWLAWRQPAQFTAQFENWFNDSLSFRALFIRWNNVLRLALFHESAVKGVRIGQQGWLYYADEWNMEDYENIMPYSQNDLAGIARVLEQRRCWLAARGIKFFVLVAPNKHTIYPEYLPPHIHKIGQRSRLDQVAGYLAAHTDIELIDVRSELLAAKEKQHVYHLTDSHWNDRGAFVACKKIMERINKYFPAVSVPHEDAYTIAEKLGDGGDLANMLTMKDILKEERITMTPKAGLQAIESTRDYPDPVSLAGREMVVRQTGDLRLPRALVFRDSFGWALIPFFAEFFQSSVYVWTFDFLPELIEREKPDIVIFECAERYITSLTQENPETVRAVYKTQAEPPAFYK